MTEQVKITAHMDGAVVVVAKGRSPDSALSKFMHRYNEKFRIREGKHEHIR